MDAQRQLVSRRALVFTAIMVAVLLLGVALFFRFVDRTQPLLETTDTTAVVNE
jgi:hypothetical protein